jgi:peptidoglycan-associated lipoprotein
MLALGCGGAPPVDALQAANDAIQNAELARDCAPEEYRAAERLLEQAQEASDAGDYDRALTLAQAAQEQAERARLTAQANADDCEALNAQQEQLDEDRSRIDVRVDTDYDLTPVYFGFDASELSHEARETLNRHARYLLNNDYRIVVQGHCDERGTDQYNLALGDRRARSVASYLMTQGVPPSRISTISFGEFRPVSASDYALNRRAEFVLVENQAP